MAFMFGVVPMILLSPIWLPLALASEVLEKAFDIIAPFIQSVISMIF